MTCIALNVIQTGATGSRIYALGGVLASETTAPEPGFELAAL